MTTVAEIAPGLAQIKSSLEADALRAEIRDLTERLDRARRRLKSEKSHSKRLRRKLDQINHRKDNDNMTIEENTITDQTDQTATERDDTPVAHVTPNERTAAGLADSLARLNDLFDEVGAAYADLRRYAAAASATLGTGKDATTK